MRRREFIALLGSTAPAWSVVARAAPGDAASGFLNSESPDGMTSNLAGFHGGL